MSSIKTTGIPWEIGLSEVHQVLLLNNLRILLVVKEEKLCISLVTELLMKWLVTWK